MHRFAALTVLSLALSFFSSALPVSADETGGFTIQPSSGSVHGGTVVTITGRLSNWPYYVMFGDDEVPSHRMGNMLVVITPPGMGTVPVVVIEGDMGIAQLEYTYVSNPGDEIERLLLPILTPPAQGAHGSEFRTELRAYNRSTYKTVTIEGVGANCPVLCVTPIIQLEPGSELRPEDVTYAGSPGRFVYVPRWNVEDLWMYVRVFDTSRSDDNYGTAIPVVRQRDMFIGRPIVFAGIPTEPRFRNTLRIYGTKPAVVTVELAHGGSTVTRQVALEGGQDALTPSYAVLGELPTGGGPLRITIRPPEPGQQSFGMPMWAFVSVTNNETQMITVVTP